MSRTRLYNRLQQLLLRASLATAPRAITRRSAVALLAAAASCSPKRPSTEPRSESIGIIGAGASGLVAAWRLANAGLSCEIFEASGRVGGRIYTLRDFTPTGQFCELGGEFVSSTDKALIDLCAQLGISLQPVRSRLANDRYDIGGVIRSPHDLMDMEGGTGAFVSIAERIAADQAALLDDKGGWTARARDLDALPLSKYLASLSPSTENWVIDLIALAYRTEFGLPVDRQSSLNLIDSIGAQETGSFAMFGDQDEMLRIAGGAATLPEAIAERLQSQPLAERVGIQLRHRLVAISRDALGFRLVFADETGKLIERSFKRLALALPFTALREIKGLGGLGLSTAKMQAINKLGYGAISKLAVATVGPLRDAMAPALDGRLWSDRGFQCVWDGGITQSREGGVLINMFGGAAAMGEETAALHTLQTGLEALAPELASTLIPNLRASFFWPRHPYTKGSRATCLPGQYTSLLEHAAAPELDGRVMFAGEHTSPEHHGSMNGAVAAGERAARELLAINS